MSQDGPTWPQHGPRWPQHGPRWPQYNPRWPQMRPRHPKHDLNIAQYGPKMASSWLPNGFKMATIPPSQSIRNQTQSDHKERRRQRRQPFNPPHPVQHWTGACTFENLKESCPPPTFTPSSRAPLCRRPRRVRQLTPSYCSVLSTYIFSKRPKRSKHPPESTSWAILTSNVLFNQRPTRSRHPPESALWAKLRPS
jgi:hypothetical protein